MERRHPVAPSLVNRARGQTHPKNAISLRARIRRTARYGKFIWPTKLLGLKRLPKTVLQSGHRELVLPAGPATDTLFDDGEDGVKRDPEDRECE